ncbi:hypothetical protein ABPG74_003005 [Tetrahymena malaccensis]
MNQEKIQGQNNSSQMLKTALFGQNQKLLKVSGSKQNSHQNTAESQQRILKQYIKEIVQSNQKQNEQQRKTTSFANRTNINMKDIIKSFQNSSYALNQSAYTNDMDHPLHHKQTCKQWFYLI